MTEEGVGPDGWKWMEQWMAGDVVWCTVYQLYWDDDTSHNSTHTFLPYSTHLRQPLAKMSEWNATWELKTSCGGTLNLVI